MVNCSTQRWMMNQLFRPAHDLDTIRQLSDPRPKQT